MNEQKTYKINYEDIIAYIADYDIDTDGNMHYTHELESYHILLKNKTIISMYTFGEYNVTENGNVVTIEEAHREMSEFKRAKKGKNGSKWEKYKSVSGMRLRDVYVLEEYDALFNSFRKHGTSFLEIFYEMREKL